MLACSRAGRRATFARHVARTFATDAAQPDSTLAPASPPGDRSRKRQATMRVEFHPRRIRDGFSIYVRPWDEIDSMTTLFAMIRGVEKRFGRVREFRVGRDHDVPSTYTTFFIAELEDAESYERVPDKGTSVRVQVPLSRRNRPGGVGLDELQELLQSQEWEPEASGDGVYSTPIRTVSSPEGETVRTKVVELIVQRSTGPQTEVRHRRRMKENAQFGLNFCRWAGFYQPPPDDASPPLQKEMARTLSKWEPFLEERNKNRSHETARNETDNGSVDNLNLDSSAQPSQAASEAGEELASASDTSAAASHNLVDELPNPSQSSAESIAEAQASATANEGSAPESAPAPAPAPAAQHPPRLSQREKILQRARQHAKTPLPQELTKEAAEQKAAEEAARKEEEQKTTNSFRERLVQLMGGKW